MDAAGIKLTVNSLISAELLVFLCLCLLRSSEVACNETHPLDYRLCLAVGFYSPPADLWL